MILGRGFVGTKLFKYLNSKETTEAFLFSKSELDYTDSSALDKNFWEDNRMGPGPPDVVINASGYTGSPNIDAAEFDKANCWKYNVIVPKNVYEVCLKNNVSMIHVSSGCIYNGYEKEWEESDAPNFGLYTDDSSFYSKTKHAAETLMPEAYHYRIRMPFSGQPSDRNYFDKIINYEKLINVKNSMTSLEDFCLFVYKTLRAVKDGIMKPGVFNVVNSGSASARNVLEIMGVDLRDREFISIDKLHSFTAAKRSNCILSTKNIERMGLSLPPVDESLKKAISIWNNYE